MCPIAGRSVLHFGPFVVDLDSGELRKNGARIRLQEKSVRVLAVLAERPGQLVSRDELKKHLWPDDTFVDFEAGLNAAVTKLRSALADDSAKPRYIETVPRRGYRFLVSVELTNLAAGEPLASAENRGRGAGAAPATTTAIEQASLPQGSRTRRSRVWLWAGGIALGMGTLGLAAAWLFYSHPAFSFSQRDSVLVTDFENQTGDPRFDQALHTAFTVSLEQSRRANVFPQVRLATALRLMGKAPGDKITPAVGRELCQREGIRGLITGSITRTGQEYELSAELIDPESGATIKSYSQRSYGEGHILDALDVIASDVRRDLGESLYQIHRADRPLPEVTTESLEALKEYADGTALWHQGHFKESVTLLRAAVESDPDFAMAHEALGVAYFSELSNSPVQGKQEYDKALALSSRTTDREHLFIQANYVDDLGHVADADALYHSYLSRYPDDLVMLMNYAHFLRMHQRQAEAIAEYKEILRVAPDDAKTYVDLAAAYKGMDDLPKALTAYAEAFRLDPRWLTASDISREYGSILIENGQEQQAAKVFTDMLNKPETREKGLRGLAMLDLFHGRYANAKKGFEECLVTLEQQQAPLSKARVHLWLASVAEGQGDTRRELKEIGVAKAQFQDLSSSVIFGSWIGQRYARAHAIAQAAAIEKVIARAADPKNNEQMSYLHLLEGEIAAAQGDSGRAIELLALSNKEQTNSITVEALAHAYQESGNIDEAIAWHENLLGRPVNRSILWEPQPWWLKAHYTLAADYVARGNREKARQAIDSLLSLWNGADANLLLRNQALKLREQIQ